MGVSHQIHITRSRLGRYPGLVLAFIQPESERSPFSCLGMLDRRGLPWNCTWHISSPDSTSLLLKCEVCPGRSSVFWINVSKLVCFGRFNRKVFFICLSIFVSLDSIKKLICAHQPDSFKEWSGCGSPVLDLQAFKPRGVGMPDLEPDWDEWWTPVCTLRTDKNTVSYTHLTLPTKLEV